MRVVTWNCLMATDRKVPHMLDALAPDIAIVPESARHPGFVQPGLLGPGIPHAWTGLFDFKGLGIYAPSATHLEVLPPAEPGPGQHGLAARASLPDRAVDVLAVWTMPLAGFSNGYLAAAEAILKSYGDLINHGDCVVAGDFNVSAQSAEEQFPEFLGWLRDEFGLRSAYHHFHGCEPGQETDMTLWWQKNREAGYHCDLVLVPESWRVEHVSIGAYEQWGDGTLPVSSDHAPVTVDLTRAGRPVTPDDGAVSAG